jgi:hypothetical protein
MASPSFVELRRSRRVPEATPIFLVFPSDDCRVKHEAFTVDQSLHGAGIRTGVQLSPGQAIVILPREGYWHTVPARVVWARAAEVNDGYFAGLEFAKPSSGKSV